MADESRFAKGDLNSVMAAYPHVADWVRDLNLAMVLGQLTMDHLTGMPKRSVH